MTSSDPIVFTVEGRPRPQGSKSGVITDSGKVRILEGRDSRQRELFKAWRSQVAAESFVALARARRITPFRGPVGVLIEFRFQRPQSAKRSQFWKSTQPDVDKLARAVLDGLQSGAMIGNDGQVALLVARKVLAPPGASDSALIGVWPLDQDDGGFTPPTSITAALTRPPMQDRESA